MSARRDSAGDSEARPHAQDLPPASLDERRPPAPNGACSAPRGHRAAGLYLLFAVVSLCTRLPFLRGGFVNMDEAAHLLGAAEWLRGGRLYVDFADNKPPLVYLYYAAAQALLGDGITSVRVLTAAVLVPLVALGAAAFFGLGRRGVAAGMAFVLASASLLASDAHAAHCEHVLLVPVALCLVVLRHPPALRSPARLFVAGALLGAATLAKQPAALFVGVPALFTVRASLRRGESPWGRLAALALGFAGPLVVAAALFARGGTLRSAVFWIWQFNLGHIDNPMPLADLLTRAARMGGVLVPATAPLLFAAVRGRAHAASGHRGALPVMLAVTAFFPALLGWRLFGHYFLPLLFALSLAAAPLLGSRSPRLARARAVLFGLGAFVPAGFAIANRWVFDPARHLADVVRPEYAHIGEALRADPCSREGSLFVWGYAPNVYVYAGARPASRFVVPIDSLTGYLAGNDAAEEGRVDTHGRIRAAHWAQLMADLHRSMPAHVVDLAPADLNRWGRWSLARFPLLDAFVRRHYHASAVVDGAVIYARNGCDGPRVAGAPRGAAPLH